MKKFLFTIGALLLSVTTASAGWAVTVAQWAKIVAEIIIALFSSNSPTITQEIIHEKSREYGIDECEMWKRGGFGHRGEIPQKCKNKKESTFRIEA